MPTRERALDRAIGLARVSVARAGDEIRRARRSAGISQAVIAHTAGISRSQLSRLERGRLERVWVDELFRASAAVGLTVSVRSYPLGDPVRDAGHLRLLERFRQVLHPSLAFRTEVPLPAPGDPRAWDGVVTAPTWRRPVEAETVLDDLQAVERRLQLKLRDGGFDELILVVADTARNRRALAAAPTAFSAFPLRGREILPALRAGHQPPGSGLVLL